MRGSLAVLALAALVLAGNRYEAWHTAPDAYFGGAGGIWLSWIAATVASGFLFGLAIWLPSAAVRYARSGLLLAALVSIPILQFWLIFSSQSDPNGVPGRWLLRFDWLLDPYSVFVPAALAGVAIASGFRQPDPTSRAG
jgi:hypothetical protein